MVPAFTVVFIRPTSVNVDTKAAIGFLLYNERTK
jgi:xanthine/uracil/vitamin C permease (AzgA family)